MRQDCHEGSILATQSYSAFGTILSQTGSSNNAQKYTGREIDSETGFYYYRARYYDPVRGNFISEDPKGFGAGVNFYAYAENNPVNFNDPSGLCGLATPLCVAAAEALTPEAAIAASLQAARLGEYGIQAYNTLRPAIQGLGLEAHHLLEKRFAEILGVKAKDMLSIAMSKGEHQVITNAWRSRISYGAGTADATAESVLNAASIIYQSSPTILKALGLGLGVAGSANASSASGGFLLYPNKSNTNQLQSVYQK